MMHIAETKEQAYKNVEFGIEHWFNYFQKVAAFRRWPSTATTFAR
jgi:limonene 1,2-monooxygenase